MAPAAVVEAAVTEVEGVDVEVEEEKESFFV